MRKLIKNYTTDIPVERTITEIQKILARNGARGIALEYGESGNIKDIFFKIILNNKELPFRLPAKAGRVYQALWGGKRSGNTSGTVKDGDNKLNELHGGFVRRGLKHKSR
jgi:hypothetical protein